MNSNSSSEELSTPILTFKVIMYYKILYYSESSPVVFVHGPVLQRQYTVPKAEQELGVHRHSQ